MIMNNLNVSLFRLFGILIISNFILYLNFIFHTIKEILSAHHQFYIISIVVFFLFPIVVGALMIINPYQFSKKIKILPKINNEEYNLNEILGICIILLGMFFLINSVIMITIEIIQVYIINLKVKTEIFFDERALSYIVGYIFKILVGLFFIFKGMRISDYIVNKR